MDTAGGSVGLLRSFRLYLTVEGLRPTTIRHYALDVERFFKHCPAKPSKVKAADIRNHLAALQTDHSAKTVREAQLALRRFFRFLLQDGEIAKDPTKDMKLMSYRVDPQPTYSEQEVKRLLLVCDQRTRVGLRNRALVLTLFDTGVREGELVSMGVPDWDRRQVRVEGKKGIRDVPLGMTALQAVDRYVRRWGIDGGYLWRGKKGALSPSGVLQLVRRLCREAGVEQKGVHAFRRAAAAQMKRLGMNDSDILEVMGWKDVTMLRRYIAAVASELAHAAHKKHSPADALAN